MILKNMILIHKITYQKIIKDDETFSDLMEELNFESNEELTNIDFDKQNVVVILSRYEIKEVKTNIGNMKFEFGNIIDDYSVNIFIVSKVVNTNCLYYNTNLEDYNISIFYTSDDENGLDYFVEDEKYYAIVNHSRVEIISQAQACDIADIEAQNEKYQYQGWKSEFYSRGIEKNEGAYGVLILGLNSIDRFSLWREEWQNEEYEDKIMWQIRLFDENDPLTSLYIYVDAITGNVVGAGESSD